MMRYSFTSFRKVWKNLAKLTVKGDRAIKNPQPKLVGSEFIRVHLLIYDAVQLHLFQESLEKFGKIDG
jgi:hypothetical protein